MGTNHSEVAFFIFQNSIDTYQLIDRKQTKYQDILFQSYSPLLLPEFIGSVLKLSCKPILLST